LKGLKTSPFTFALVKTLFSQNIALLGFLAVVIDMCIPEVWSLTAMKDSPSRGKTGSLSVEHVLN